MRFTDISFDELVARCRKNHSPQKIYNSSLKHASILLKNLIEEATVRGRAVRIVSGKLSPSFYNQFAEDISHCMKEMSVEVLVLDQNFDSEENDFGNAVLNNENGHLYVASGNINIDDFIHFTVVGTESYRLEKYGDFTKAEACFDSPIIGDYLFKNFNNIKKFIGAKEVQHNNTTNAV